VTPLFLKTNQIVASVKNKIATVEYPPPPAPHPKKKKGIEPEKKKSCKGSGLEKKNPAS